MILEMARLGNFKNMVGLNEKHQYARYFGDIHQIFMIQCG